MIRLSGSLILALVLVTLALFAAPALAEEADAETRFHDAYVLEVIDGRIAEAAKTYLALVGDEGVPTRIRDEARFRFAICTVLLGRPDEGRMQLASIVKNERTPVDLRGRAEAYLESISTLGVGTELERKLQSLVFDLGRSDSTWEEIPAYRDFEIIGEPAIPFLENLLQHADVKLRRHAFRLLIRLGAEDLVARWTPEISLLGEGFCKDFTDLYLQDRPAEIARLESKLLALDDELLERELDLCRRDPDWSFEFVRRLTARPALRPDAFRILGRAGTPAQRWAFARECILGDDEELRDFGAEYAVHDEQGPPDAMVEELWPPFLRSMAAQGWSLRSTVGSRSGNLHAWATRVPTPMLLVSLEELVAAGETWPEGQKGDPLRGGLASLLTAGLAKRDLDEAQLGVYEALLKRWVLAVAPRLKPSVDLKFHPASVVRPLRNLIERLPADRALAFVRWLFEGPAHERAVWFKRELAIDRPEDIGLLLEAVRAVAPDQREILVRQLPGFYANSPGVETARVMAEALPGFLRLTSASKLDGPPGRGGRLTDMAELVGRLPDEVLTKVMGALFETAAEMEEGTPRALFDRLVNFQAQTAKGLLRKTSFLVRYVLPAIAAGSENLSPSFRRYVLQRALFPLRNRYGFAEGDKERLAAHVLAHQDDLPDRDLRVLALHPELFPLEEWLPAAAARVLIGAVPLHPTQVDPAMKILTADVSKIDDAVLRLLVRSASAEVAEEVVGRMLASEDAGVRHRAIGALHGRTGYPATPAGLETTLASLLAEEAPDLGDLARVALMLAETQPSERLLPAAERLLASEEKKDRLQGILLANRLGHEKLVPALARLLDSLDPDLRDRARKAILAIQELRRLKEEAQQPR